MDNGVGAPSGQQTDTTPAYSTAHLTSILEEADAAAVRGHLLRHGILTHLNETSTLTHDDPIQGETVIPHQEPAQFAETETVQHDGDIADRRNEERRKRYREMKDEMAVESVATDVDATAVTAEQTAAALSAIDAATLAAASNMPASSDATAAALAAAEAAATVTTPVAGVLEPSEAVSVALKVGLEDVGAPEAVAAGSATGMGALPATAHEAHLAKRRLKDRQRYASMTPDQRQQYNAKRRSQYHRQTMNSRQKRRDRERVRYHSVEEPDRRRRNERRAKMERERYRKLSPEELADRNRRRRERAATTRRSNTNTSASSPKKQSDVELAQSLPVSTEQTANIPQPAASETSQPQPMQDIPQAAPQIPQNDQGVLAHTVQHSLEIGQSPDIQHVTDGLPQPAAPSTELVLQAPVVLSQPTALAMEHDQQPVHGISESAASGADHPHVINLSEQSVPTSEIVSQNQGIDISQNSLSLPEATHIETHMQVEVHQMPAQLHAEEVSQGHESLVTHSDTPQMPQQESVAPEVNTVGMSAIQNTPQQTNHVAHV